MGMGGFAGRWARRRSGVREGGAADWPTPAHGGVAVCCPLATPSHRGRQSTKQTRADRNREVVEKLVQL